MLEYNEELQGKVGDIAAERDEMRQLILDQGQESWLADVRKSSVSLTEVRPATPKRSLELVEAHRKRLDEAVDEEDQIDPEMEEQYLAELEALVAGSRRSVGPDQGEALLAIRREYLRRELTIAVAMQTIEQLEEEQEVLQTENDELADSIVLQIAYNKELNGQVEALTHEVTKMGEEATEASLKSKAGRTAAKEKFKKLDLPKLPGENPFSAEKISALRARIGDDKFKDPSEDGSGPGGAQTLSVTPPKALQGRRASRATVFASAGNDRATNELGELEARP